MEQDQKQSPLLVVSNLTLKHQRPDTSTTILRDVSFELRAGEILGLIGESGAGKSTLGNAVLGLLAPGFSQTGGQILFRGQAFDEMSDKDRLMVRGRRISAIFQDHTASLDPLMCIGSQIVETIQALDRSLTARQARAHALDLMERVGIQDPAGRYSQYPHQFSGGQRQRIVIAIALAGKPDIIVADEPTSALDATVQKQILGLLRKLTEETGVSIILVTHDMGVISEIADRVVVMRHGKVVEQGATSSILDAPAEPYTRDLLAAVPRLRLSGVHQPPVNSHGAEVNGDTIDPVRLAGARSILSVKGVTKTFARRSLPWLRSDRQSFALQDVTIEIERGAITGIVGESGSGKSTIGRIVAGLETANQGTLEIDGAGFDISRSGRKSGLLGQVQMIFQDPAMSLNPRMSVGSALEQSVRSGNRGSKSYAHEVGDLMDRLGLPKNLLKSFPHQLSGGQKQRVCIARALLARPSIIVADEPTSALDVSVQAEIVTLLKETVRERGLSMLFISHDLALVQDLCHAIYIFKDGIVEDSGPTDFIFSQSDNPYTRRLIDARPLRFTH
ncbi:ABC transporter ATP-binding protein [Rhizobium skierniewicense]|uniref:dipeptide ABC transporter ATP-binding protein n=1 Tax=Rhizobium TaxID=379 RepID=UPI00177E5724|nr:MULTISPECIES: ABC transporter ATP-binding protein [Rhizobium]MBD8689502.1 ABC transporter ATP-binding protein [Rhizobium sp. CFBP 13644]MBD8693976.1 ABC transporter ATP-binding protein [Rhizobium sp. CFBP 13717]MCI9868463.1 ABC transporter ATP-binding protein [Rhizobium skierniewicense]